MGTTDLPSTAVFTRLLMSAILGGAVGIEREGHHRPAGLRTHVLVSMGSCLVTLVGAYALPSISRDPFRMAAQVVSGVGFLGAGTIMREGASVKGLTTAASLWVVSGVGLAVGAGYFMGAAATAAMVVLSLIALSALEDRMWRSAQLSVRLAPGANDLSDLFTALQACNASPGASSLTRDEGTNALMVAVTLEPLSPARRAEVMAALADLPCVTYVGFAGHSGDAVVPRA